MRVAVFLSGAIAILIATVASSATAQSTKSCPVTLDRIYGNDKLSIHSWRNGTLVIPKDYDGWLRQKHLWKKGVHGSLSVSGKRLDAPAPRLKADIQQGFDNEDFQPSMLQFPTPGCWEVTAQVGEIKDSRLTFIVRVVQAGTQRR